ncbi:MAG: DUF3267 domain-containing protein, partial [Clostridia bacterium]|nr:DUF3267 domain-containing protein [Clostridia bacterium]
IDAKKASVGIILNVFAGVIAVALIAALYLAKFGLNVHQFYEEDPTMLLIAALVFCVSMIAYLVVHELTHGAAYKLLTKQKLRFGLTLTVAYCGLKEGYVNKKTSLIATLAPFVLHSIWMIIAFCLLPDNVWALVVIMLFALHFGGCIGDLWVTGILLFKYAGKAVLVSDDGPCQRFYTYSGGETDGN